MSNALDDITGVANKILRRSAQRYAVSVNRYGAALAGYGDGKKELLDVARTGLDVAVGEARGAIELGVSLGEAYYRWSAGLIGIRLGETTSQKSAPTPRPKPSGAKGA